MDEVESLRIDPIFTLEEFSNIYIDPGKVRKRLRNNAKKTKEIKLQNKYGAIFRMSECLMPEYGYRFVQSKPKIFF